ncbi:DUF6508 domain-containing protein [Bacillus sp. IBL03825]|uniref:DUF6508 domain-containing protein n=1 Tax=Bacillus sp. IBL03825 TaxID=2953580 RepID=UPI002157E7B8|nr:DUF6508 domain-containing protein [Bacillus sp. IBL03825]MCR6850487.1 DUF6508 domain-containing protein [Bacillus sp. IBL03825]MCR6850493.1 DUF6508 domain-containing protein [Bacillus sp. IBL03825]
MEKFINIDRITINRILLYKNYFEDSSNIFYKTYIASNGLSSFHYSNEVLQFQKDLKEHKFLLNVDFVRISNKSQFAKYIKYPNLITNASFETLRKLLTYHICREEWCEGHLANMIDRRQIVKILFRLKDFANKG